MSVNTHVEDCRCRRCQPGSLTPGWNHPQGCVCDLCEAQARNARNKALLAAGLPTLRWSLRDKLSEALRAKGAT